MVFAPEVSKAWRAGWRERERERERERAREREKLKGRYNKKGEVVKKAEMLDGGGGGGGVLKASLKHTAFFFSWNWYSESAQMSFFSLFHCLALQIYLSIYLSISPWLSIYLTIPLLQENAPNFWTKSFGRMTWANANLALLMILINIFTSRTRDKKGSDILIYICTYIVYILHW